MFTTQYTNIAFISYKREDEEWAKWLQKKLEHYKLPTEIRKQNPDLEFAKNPRHVFKDTTDLSGGVLAKAIKEGLDSSKFLIVICSPRAAKSEWVCKEVKDFIDSGREEYIIPFIIDGEPYAKNSENECFPEALKALAGERELLGININENGRESATVKVIARMFNVRFDTLWQRFLREQKKRRKYTIGALIGAILFLLGIGTWIGWQYIQLEDANKRIETQKKEIAKERDVARIQRDKAEKETARANQEKDRANKEKNRAETFSQKLLQANDSIRQAYEKLNVSEKNLAKSNADLKESNIQLALERDNVLKSNYELTCSQTRSIAKEANLLIEEGNLTMAVKLLLNVVPNKNNNYTWPYVAEAEAALRRAVDSLNVNYWHQEMTLEHNLKITSACFSPDDKYIVTSSNDNTAKLWNSETGSLVFPPFVHDGLVNCALFTPDGESLITGCRDRKARKFSLSNASLEQEYDIKGNVWSMAINPISNDLLCYSNSGLSFWDYMSGNNKYWFGGASRIGKESFTNDGRFIWCVGNRLMIVRDNAVLNKLSSEFAKYKEEEEFNEDSLLNFLKNNTKYIEMEGTHESKYCGISASGDYAYIVSWDSIARLYDTNSKALLRVQNNVHYASLSPENDYWVTAGVDGNCMVYSIVDNEPLDLEICHESNVVYCNFSPNGQYLVTTSLDKKAKIWNVWEGWHLEATLQHDRPVIEAVFSNSSDDLITIQNNNIAKVWRTPVEYYHQVALLMKNAFPSMISFNRNSNIMLLPSLDRSVLSWNLTANEEMFRSKYYKSVASYAEFSHDNQKVAVSFNDGTARILNAHNGIDYDIILRHRDYINSISYSPNDKFIVTASSDSTAIVWDAVTGEKISQELQHRFKVRKALFANNSNVITVSADSIFLWSFTGKILSKGTTNRTSIEDFDVSFDGKKIAVCDDNNNIMIYDTYHLERKPRIWTHGGLEMPQRGLYLDYRAEIEQEDTTWLNSSISGSNVGRELYRLLSHKSAVNSVSFSEDGTKIISSSENAIKVWDVATGVLISNNMKHPWRIQYSNVSPNSKYVVSVNNDNKESLLSVWKYLPYKDLIENTIKRFKSFILNDEEKLRYNIQ